MFQKEHLKSASTFKSVAGFPEFCSAELQAMRGVGEACSWNRLIAVISVEFACFFISLLFLFTLNQDELKTKLVKNLAS
jgi:hypothetical protein